MLTLTVNQRNLSDNFHKRKATPWRNQFLQIPLIRTDINSKEWQCEEGKKIDFSHE